MYLLFIMMLTACQPSGPVEPSRATLRIMETSDVHAQLTGYDYFSNQPVQRGLVHTASVIHAARTEVSLSVLIENGDLLQGSPVADWIVAGGAGDEHNGNPFIQALNYLDYDAANLGNHEFNYGLEYLAEAYSQAQFPVLSANIHWLDDAPGRLRKQIQPYTILHRVAVDQHCNELPVNIAVIGVMPPQIMQWDARYLSGRATMTDMVTAAALQVKTARAQGADIVILAAHTGMPKQTQNPKDTEQAGWELAGIPGIDALLLGHQHEVFPGTGAYDDLPGVDSGAGRIRGVPAVQPGAYGEHLGIIDLDLEFSDQQWRVVSTRSSIRATDSGYDSGFADKLQAVHQATKAFVAQPVGYTAQPLSYRRARLQPELAVQLIHQAQLWYAQHHIPAERLDDLPLLSATAPFNAALSAEDEQQGRYTEINAGQVTLGDIADLYRYPNTLDVVKLNGAQIKRWLEFSAQAVSEPEASKREQSWAWVNTDFPGYNFDSLFGLSYRIDPRRAQGDRILALHYGKQAVTDDMLFLVMVNSYRATGGGDVPDLDGSTLVYRSPDQIQDILVRYFRYLGENGYQEELVKHWNIEGIPTSD
ncbi:hypothetical protein IDSA_03950 [Pseudidiomarina salinarum]|uniref:Uncharacterized protein n=2 Tax=Pseudidiomarina salinarum TaxID=435908 RepID=A0A094JH47_9GAMM|nr:hypothetical protein IDSA_03950 [Pseudidiomarina salinarum]